MSDKNILILFRQIKAAVILILLFPCSGTLFADSAGSSTSKRIEVYALAQKFWDVRRGDTLGAITQQLLPNNPAKRAALQLDILQLNPAAFINDDPSLLLAGKRLWLPSYIQQADTKVDPATTTVEHYSWGSIKRSKSEHIPADD